ncbi:MAG: SAM-dependent methyltransferase [Archangium gephyra]|uniref:SAM-dependent methyltransferase n=1 Tax=Archangium gephyra TaxID=48 RepID=A0A2W5TJR4_9BACT|nr:MAG: SAM-dependent methyltransferase [Archangium gephyra]
MGSGHRRAGGGDRVRGVDRVVSQGVKPLSSLKERPLREDLVTLACLEAYGAVRHDGRLADRALDYTLRNKKHLYSQERRAVAERVYSMLRKQRLVDFLAEVKVKGFTGLSTSRKDMMRLAISRVLDGDDVSSVLAALSLPGTEGSWLRTVVHAKSKLAEKSELQRFAIEASIPDFLAEKLLAELGDEARPVTEAMNKRGPLTARLNPLKTNLKDLTRALEAEDVKVTPTLLSPFGLILETRTNVYALKAFKEGLFEVQDEGSQLLGMLVDAPPRKVFDACAGAGGKTLQLAAQMKNRGEIYALDVDERRLEELKLRARRAGVHNVRIQAIAKGPEADEQLVKWHGQAERVLVDAPCSGSGTWRRKPDARYRMTPEMLAEHVQIQKTLVARFAKLVKPGGRLIYGTCSLLREENEGVVEDFLASHPDFELVPATPWLGEELAPKVTRGGMLRLFPHRHETDGLFGAVLVRKGK